VSLNSCIYEGNVRHRRNMPKHHQFDFKSFMLLLDLDELDSVFKNNWLWSTRRISFARFKQSQYVRKFSDEPNLRRRVDLILQELGFEQPVGSIRLLTQFRYLGFAMNPVSFYYCYSHSDETPEQIVAIIAEVNNTPWGEQHHYLIQSPSETTDPKKPIRAGNIEKSFHVSPFMSMEMSYRMAFTQPDENLGVKIENHLHEPADLPKNGDLESPQSKSTKILDVAMLMERKPITSWNLNWMLIKYPLISFKIWAGIYWQAVRLHFKKIPFHSHPKNRISKDQLPQVLSSQSKLAEQNSFDNPVAQKPDSETVLVSR